MKRRDALLLSFITLCGVPTIAGALRGQSAEPNSTAPESIDVDTLYLAVTGRHSTPWTIEERCAAQARALRTLLGTLSSTSAPESVQRERELLEGIGHWAARPGAEAEREHWCRLLAGATNPIVPLETRAWLLQKLGEIGERESVEPLRRLLHDAELRIRELARAALAHNPSPEATTALVETLQFGDDSDLPWLVALIEALGTQGATMDTVGRDHDAASASEGDESDLATARAAAFELLHRYAVHEDESLRLAAIGALADFGHEPALSVLVELHNSRVDDANDRTRIAAADAALRVAHEVGGSWAATVQRDLYYPDTPPYIRAACLTGLAATDAETWLRLAEPILRGEREPELRTVAFGCLRDLPEIPDALRRAYPDLDERGRILFLRALADRGEPALAVVPRSELGSSSAIVRTVAVESLVSLGSAADVTPLARIAADGSDSVQDAARETLMRCRSTGFDDEIRARLRDSALEDEARAELIRAATARRCDDLLPTLTELSKSGSPTMRVAALRGLAELGDAHQVPALLEQLAQASDENGSVRRALERTIAELARDDGPATRSLIEALPNAMPTTERSLLTILGQVRSPEALDALRARAEHESETGEVALRAIARWQDPAAIDVLLGLAERRTDEKGRRLALRGFFRLVKEARPTGTSRDDAETLRRIERGLALSPAVDDQRLAASILGDLACEEALGTAERLRATHPQIESELRLALCDLARRTAGRDRARSRAIIDRLADPSPSVALSKKIEEARALLDSRHGFLGRWEVAGPFHDPDVSGAALLAHAFPPERSEGFAGVEWRPWCPHGDDPWLLDLTEIDGGSQRAI
ncbi:MAG: hypothetical protein KDC38_03260, partial [Planctomycetes bacterium]|nr:hypothetical protein [Planctomycetota bacterium]